MICILWTAAPAGKARGGAEKMVGMQSDGEQESEREREKESAGGNA